ncbi:MAG: TetR/AcrR family transcriptional regulator [Segniliparus sp.]|uniref:TetR/AcrR family transcriptional regulator n=1 Tax=Segniliparus sp. TaxID=2804064 RepID=UPI003F2DB863
MSRAAPGIDLEALIAAAMGDELYEEARKAEGSGGKILDAAVAVLGESGERGLTMDKVAKRAGMGRGTVFRLFGSKQNLVDTAYRRDLLAQLRDLGDRASRCATAGDVAELAMARSLEDAHANPVARWLVRLQPERIVRLWRDYEPSGQAIGRSFLSGLLQDPGLPDALAEDEADFVADTLNRLLATFVLVPRGEGLSEASGRLREAVRRLLPR